MHFRFRKPFFPLAGDTVSFSEGEKEMGSQRKRAGNARPYAACFGAMKNRKSPQLSGSFRSGRSPMTQPCGFLHTGQTFHASSASTIWPQFAQRQTMGLPFL